MRQFDTDLPSALLWLEEYHRRLELKFMGHYEELKFGFGADSESSKIAKYIDGLGNWVRANDCWNFESQRYFGADGRWIQNNRRVPLLPR